MTINLAPGEIQTPRIVSAIRQLANLLTANAPTPALLKANNLSDVADAKRAIYNIRQPLVVFNGSGTVTIDHHEARIVCIGSGFTLALTAAATLGNGFRCDIVNATSGSLILDPAGAEVIDGVATITLLSKEGVTIETDGVTGWGTMYPTVGTVPFSHALTLSEAQELQARTNIYAAPFDALAYNGMQINGSMEVSQENGTNSVSLVSSTTVDKYIVDGTVLGFHSGTAVVVGQQVVVPGSPAFGLAFPYCLQMKATTGAAFSSADDFIGCHHAIEGYRAARLGFGGSAAQSITIGFWVYATVAGTMCVAVRNAGVDRSYPVDVTINNATTWEWKTVTVPGDTTGTWNATNGVGLYVGFFYAIASGYQGTPNTWQAGNKIGTASTTNFFSTNNNIACITGLIILPGAESPTSTRSPLIIRPRDQELQICKRYFVSNFPYGVPPADNAIDSEVIAACYLANSARVQRITFPVELFGAAAPPTIAFYSSNLKAAPTAGKWQYFNGAAWADLTGTTAQRISSVGFTPDVSVAGLAAGSAYAVGGGWKAYSRPEGY